jgi:hypothetical protein
MTKNAAGKKAVRTLMADLGIPYSEAKRRLSDPCDHYLMVGDDYGGDQVVFCHTCDLPADSISADDAEHVYLDCEVHSLSEARLTGNLMECMNAHPIGDEGDGLGPVMMSCQSSYPGWAD